MGPHRVSRFSKEGITSAVQMNAMDSNARPRQHLKQIASRVLKTHPWLKPVGLLLIGLEQVREALYDHANSGWAILDWIFAAACLIMFVPILVDTISDYQSRTADQVDDTGRG